MGRPILVAVAIGATLLSCTPGPVSVTVVGRTDPSGARVIQSVRIVAASGSVVGDYPVALDPQLILLVPGVYDFHATARAAGSGDLVREPGMMTVPPERVPTGADDIPGVTIANCDARIAIGSQVNRVVVASRGRTCTILAEASPPS